MWSLIKKIVRIGWVRKGEQSEIAGVIKFPGL